MKDKVFDPKKLDKLNNPLRLQEFPLEYILKLTKIETPQVIIDVGAGTGFFSVPFAQMYTHCTIYACDISHIMIDWMNEHISSKYHNIIPTRMENHHIPLESDIADFVFMVNVHHELESPENTLKECHRVLKSGGTIAISDWKKEETKRGPSIELRYTPDEIHNQVRAIGFDNIRIHSDFPNNFLIIAEK